MGVTLVRSPTYALRMPVAPPYQTIASTVVERAWAAYGDPRAIVAIKDISATVSTNKVFNVRLSDGHEVIAKTTVYGSYVHFRQDHRIIQQWIRRLADTRYRDFLATVCLRKDGDVFTFKEGHVWVVFYEKSNFYDFLPPILSPLEIRSWGREIAEFHRASTRVAPKLASSWKSLGSDVGILFDMVENPAWREAHHMGDAAESIIQEQCDQFLTNAEKLGYHHFPKIPVLVDWNIGNFSVGRESGGFKFYSRWDYDWFRVEPRTLDFYFCARVARAEGDQEHFSYTVAPFFEDRFLEFLRSYHAVYPLEDEEVLFLKEAYRVFLLNYVIRIGEYFFQQDIYRRLQKEALATYFAELDRTSFAPLLKAIQ